MKLALGTVQFGVKYGIANEGGKVSIENATQILEKAKALGVDTLDTAAAYGNSEVLLGRVGIDDFKVVSKLPPRDASHVDVESWVSRNIESSLQKLKLDSLYGFLLHRPLELLSRDGNKLYQALSGFKEKGLIKRLGISVYGPEDLERLAPYFDLDLVQVPLNLFDRRMVESGWLARLKSQGVEVHVRSAFLQGLILMSPERRPAYFKPWQDLFSNFDAWLEQEKLSALEACLGFLNSMQDVDKIVVGVDSAEQLLEIGATFDRPLSACPAFLQSSDPALINPALWKL